MRTYDPDDKKLSDLPANKNKYDVEQEIKAQRGVCPPYGGEKLIVSWDFSEQAKENGICKISIGDSYAYVKAEDLRRYIRWV